MGCGIYGLPNRCGEQVLRIGAIDSAPRAVCEAPVAPAPQSTETVEEMQQGRAEHVRPLFVWQVTAR